MATTTPQQRGLVLVVDDDRMNRALVAEALRPEFDVVEAPEGETGLSLLEHRSFAAVVADQLLPGMSGVELLSVALGSFPSVGRVLLTGASRSEDVRDAVNLARVHRFVAKPFQPEELAAVVGGAIREARLETENAALMAELRRANERLARHEEELQALVDERTRELRAAVARLEELVLRDGLTGLYNHRFFQESLHQEAARALRYGRKLGLLFIDVDHFKSYNDRLGHPEGDSLLRAIAKILGNAGELANVRIRGRASDITCRYGGEEFVILLPEADRAGARIRAERIRDEIAGTEFEGGAGQPLGKITVSVGVASIPEDAQSKDDLVLAADQALLFAKRSGRNRVVTAAELPASVSRSA